MNRHRWARWESNEEEQDRMTLLKKVFSAWKRETDDLIKDRKEAEENMKSLIKEQVHHNQLQHKTFMKRVVFDYWKKVLYDPEVRRGLHQSDKHPTPLSHLFLSPAVSPTHHHHSSTPQSPWRRNNNTGLNLKVVSHDSSSSGPPSAGGSMGAAASSSRSPSPRPMDRPSPIDTDPYNRGSSRLAHSSAPSPRAGAGSRHHDKDWCFEDMDDDMSFEEALRRLEVAAGKVHKETSNTAAAAAAAARRVQRRKRSVYIPKVTKSYENWARAKEGFDHRPSKRTSSRRKQHLPSQTKDKRPAGRPAPTATATTNTGTAISTPKPPRPPRPQANITSPSPSHSTQPTPPPTARRRPQNSSTGMTLSPSLRVRLLVDHQQHSDLPPSRDANTLNNIYGAPFSTSTTTTPSRPSSRSNGEPSPARVYESPRPPRHGRARKVSTRHSYGGEALYKSPLAATRSRATISSSALHLSNKVEKRLEAWSRAGLLELPAFELVGEAAAQPDAASVDITTDIITPP